MIRRATGGESYFGAPNHDEAKKRMKPGDKLFVRIGNEWFDTLPVVNTQPCPKKQPTLSDALDFIGELQAFAQADSTNPQHTKQEQYSAGILASVLLNTWAELYGHLHPLRQIVAGVTTTQPDSRFVSLTLEQMQQIAANAQGLGMAANEAIHLRIHNGCAEAFVVGEQYDDGGREIYRQAALTINY